MSLEGSGSIIVVAVVVVEVAVVFVVASWFADGVLCADFEAAKVAVSKETFS